MTGKTRRALGVSRPMIAKSIDKVDVVGVLVGLGGRHHGPREPKVTLGVWVVGLVCMKLKELVWPRNGRPFPPRCGL